MIARTAESVNIMIHVFFLVFIKKVLGIFEPFEFINLSLLSVYCLKAKRNMYKIPIKTNKMVPHVQSIT
jgi:hypothetical protein